MGDGRADRRGMMLAAVLLLAMVLLALIAGMVMRTRSQAPIQGRLELQAKALAVAKGVVQLALLKFKALPTEFYRMDALRRDPNCTDITIRDAWFVDFDPDTATSPMRVYLNSLADAGQHIYRAQVIDCTLHASAPGGHTEDYLRLIVNATCDGEHQIVEELVRVSRFAP